MRLLPIAAAILLCFFVSCNDGSKSEQPRVQSNALKEYVNEPKHRALHTKNKLEAAQKKMRRQAEELE